MLSRGYLTTFPLNLLAALPLTGIYTEISWQTAYYRIPSGKQGLQIQTARASNRIMQYN